MSVHHRCGTREFFLDHNPTFYHPASLRDIFLKASWYSSEKLTERFGSKAVSSNSRVAS